MRVMFVCHGNICRSPMAEYVMKHLVRQKGLEGEIIVSSSATSREEIGNDVHRGTKDVLWRNSIACPRRSAVQITRKDYENSDYIVVMDRNNIRNLKRIIGEDDGNKVYMLRDFSDGGGDVADPWYTGDFETTFEMVYEGCKGLLERIEKE